MEEPVKQPEESFTFVFSKEDAVLVLNSLSEVPAKYSRLLINKMELAMVAQSKEVKHDS